MSISLSASSVYPQPCRAVNVSHLYWPSLLICLQMKKTKEVSLLVCVGRAWGRGGWWWRECRGRTGDSSPDDSPAPPPALPPTPAPGWRQKLRTQTRRRPQTALQKSLVNHKTITNTVQSVFGSQSTDKLGDITLPTILQGLPEKRNGLVMLKFQRIVFSGTEKFLKLCYLDDIWECLGQKNCIGRRGAVRPALAAPAGDRTAGYTG